MGIGWAGTPAGIAEVDGRPGDVFWNVDIPASISGGRAVIGWVRLTTSDSTRSNNELGVDYLPMYVEVS